MQTNTTFDQLAPVVGYRAVRIIAIWFKGRALKVPADCSRGRPIDVLLGGPAFARLVRYFGGGKFSLFRAAEDTVEVPAEVSERIDSPTRSKAARRLDNAARRAASACGEP